jgi:NHS family xanthosine MFS transporter
MSSTKINRQEAPLSEQLGLNAFKLFKDYKTALFFLFSMLLGAALQLTNAYGDVFLSEFEHFPKYADSFVKDLPLLCLFLRFLKPYLFWRFLSF